MSVYPQIFPWWMKNPQNPKAALWPQISTLVRSQFRQQQQRYLTFRKHTAIREYGYKAADKLTTKYGRYSDDTILAFNRAQNAADTLVSTVMGAKILPMMGTNGGDWDDRQAAEQATQALASLFDELDVDSVVEDLLYDAVDAGSFFCKVYPDFDEGCVCIERTPYDDVLFDDRETRYRDPLCMYERKFVDRYVCSDRYGVADSTLEGNATKRREAIMGAQTTPDLSDQEISPDIVEVFEAWRRPSFVRYDEEGNEASTADRDSSSGDLEAKAEADEAKAKGKPKRRRKPTQGRHALCVEGADILDEEYNCGTFPFIIGTPRRAREGMWGIPLMRQLAPGQRECEIMDGKFQRAHRRMGGSHILIHKNANIMKRTITNDIGDILEWDGNVPPQEWTPAPANPQSYEYLGATEARMLRFIGIPEMAAQGKLPAGLEQASGKALQTFIDEGAKYLAPWFRVRERLTRELADRILEAVADLVEDNPEYETRYKTPFGGWETMKWREIVEKRDRFVIQVDPVNALSMSTSGKLAIVDRWFDQKIIDDKEYRRLSALPDLRQTNALDLSARQIIEMRLTHMLRTGVYRGPDSFDDLDMIMELAPKFLRAREVDGVPDRRLDPIRDFIVDTKALKDQAAGAGGPPPGGPGAPPPGPGGPPGPPGGMPMPPPPDMAQAAMAGPPMAA